MDNNNKLYVVDTSVTAKLFLVEEQSEEAKHIYRQATRQEIMLLAPELTCYELISVLTQADMPLSEVKEHLLLFEKLVKDEAAKTKGPGSN